MLRKVCLLTVFLLMTGCAPANIEVSLLDSAQPAPKVAVAIFSSAEAVGRPYKKFAIITAVDKRSVRYSEEELKRMITDQAAKLGADAVIMNNATKSKKYISDGMGYVSYDQLRLEAMAIIYTDE